jgi:hypothetical protein
MALVSTHVLVVATIGREASKNGSMEAKPIDIIPTVIFGSNTFVRELT